MITKEDLLLTLNKHRISNAFLISTAEKQQEPEAYLRGDSAVVYEPHDSSYLFSLARGEDFAELVKQLKHPFRTFYINDKAYADAVRSVFPGAKLHDYLQYYIESSDFEFDEKDINPDLEIVRIDTSWTDYILSTYKSKEFSRREYIDECIETLPCFGAVYNGEKVGYILVHTNGELGPILISPEVRGMGFAKTLNQYMFNEYTKLASIGCLFVHLDNKNSQRLCSTSIIKPYEKTIIWAYI
ncbi:MAG: GNAT family N-acetyltransferase [Oscillospiraceae bacterium]